MPPTFATALVAGGMAGTAVDVALFPIDTVKTRLQSPQGFVKAGGFRGVYRGLGAAAAGSAPGAALFFATYESIKAYNSDDNSNSNPMFLHMLAASIGESVACLVRVPTEVIKANMQTSANTTQSLSSTVRLVLSETSSGNNTVSRFISRYTGGLYRGYGTTLFREIPFGMIQFPLYEYTKSEWARQTDRDQVNPIQAAACGSASGALAAGLTTPLDVIKTRLMLGSNNKGVAYKNAQDVFRQTLNEEGSAAFFKGIQPRVMWIGIGGFVFFGAYEEFKRLVSPVLG